ncbi:DUF2312 domain-containing protein [Zavarzinia compransoris]|uniref:DUF2312 domain-containing protein n=2 Tax=Zavarzinia compransoris TaxID=1264899 RepID=A0A317E8A2_9PROT|nr:DUF2312 domain-containing protein [Zavarzinia compransoris]PWR23378.1 DUF2312 domain-containing protein [Zavarzinia compransoris]TDP46050.1 uncharacterized protein (UPF0335 family) [Zavarzinia compransoris]
MAIKFDLKDYPAPLVGAPPRGHNNPPPDASFGLGESLRQMVARIERLDGEIDALNDDKREVYKEAKAQGLDPTIVRQVIRLRREDGGVRRERNETLEIYMRALGMEG